MGNTIVRALDGLDLDIEAHTFTVVMGPSGSGKSTLLYLLGGLDRATSGEITVDGARLDQMDENALALFRRRTMGFVFQSFNLIPSMTALENVAFPMQFAGITSAQRNQQARDLLGQVGLDNRAGHRPTELSGGQQQRVAIARALAGKPRLLLADEPTGNLDSAMARSVMELLEEINGRGTTILMVTHDPELAARAQRNVHIVDGQVSDLVIGTPALTNGEVTKSAVVTA